VTKIFTRRLDDGTIIIGEVSSGAAPIQVDAVLYVSAWLPPDWRTWPMALQDKVKRALDAAEREHKVGFQVVETRCEPDWDAPGTVEGHPHRYVMHIVALSALPMAH
jgi:hypothetical protein